MYRIVFILFAFLFSCKEPPVLPTQFSESNFEKAAPTTGIITFQYTHYGWIQNQKLEGIPVSIYLTPSNSIPYSDTLTVLGYSQSQISPTVLLATQIDACQAPNCYCYYFELPKGLPKCESFMIESKGLPLDSEIWLVLSF